MTPNCKNPHPFFSGYPLLSGVIPRPWGQVWNGCGTYRGGGGAGPAVFPAHPCLVRGEGGYTENHIPYTHPHPSPPGSSLPPTPSPPAVSCLSCCRPLLSPALLLLLPAVCVSTPALSPPSFLPLSQPLTEGQRHPEHTLSRSALSVVLHPLQGKRKDRGSLPGLSCFYSVVSSNQ